MSKKEDLRQELREILRRNHDAFIGQYSNEINQLLGLSRQEIDAIVPGTTDLETYDQLITIVKEASKRNISQAELKERIEELGEVGIEISKKVSSLAKLFV